MKTLTSFLIFISLTLSALAAPPKETPTPIPSATVATATVAPEKSKETVKYVSDKLQNALADLITKTVAVTGDAKDFVVKELPDVVKQLLLWKFWERLSRPPVG